MELQNELFKVRLNIFSLVHIVGNEMESVCLTSGDMDTKGDKSVSGTKMM